MEALLNIIVPLAAKYGPQLIADIVGAFKKAGYTVEQVDAIFSNLKPYDALGIDPNAPVVPENAPATKSANTLPPASPASG